MTHVRNVVLIAIAAAALAATPAAAQGRTVKAGIPSAGDITVVHVKFGAG